MHVASLVIRAPSLGLSCIGQYDSRIFTPLLILVKKQIFCGKTGAHIIGILEHGFCGNVLCLSYFAVDSKYFNLTVFIGVGVLYNFQMPCLRLLKEKKRNYFN